MRHHRLRAVVASRAKTAGLHTEVEKPGLFPPRLDEAGAAEVFIGNWDSKRPAALDLAVISGMRPGCLATTAAAGDKPPWTMKPEGETISGWGPAAKQVWQALEQVRPHRRRSSSGNRQAAAVLVHDVTVGEC